MKGRCEMKKGLLLVAAIVFAGILYSEIAQVAETIPIGGSPAKQIAETIPIGGFSIQG